MGLLSPSMRPPSPSKRHCRCLSDPRAPTAAAAQIRTAASACCRVAASPSRCEHRWLRTVCPAAASTGSRAPRALPPCHPCRIWLHHGPCHHRCRAAAAASGPTLAISHEGQGAALPRGWEGGAPPLGGNGGAPPREGEGGGRRTRKMGGAPCGGRS